MSPDPITGALEELALAARNVKRVRNRQVRAREQRSALRALAFAWFESHRKAVIGSVDAKVVGQVDASYRIILDAAERNSAKRTYVDAIASARSGLIELRGHLVLSGGGQAVDACPDFTSLAADPAMRTILERRWEECQKCVAAKAHLAAIVMMGGLLEALFVARANKLSNKSPLLAAKSAPINPKTNKVLDIRDWTLRPYIDVGHDLGWITGVAKNIAAVLADYRNYVHPEKERRRGDVLGHEDSSMLWGVTKSLVQQLLSSARSA